MLVFCVGLLSSIASIVRNYLITGPDVDLTCEFFVPHQFEQAEVVRQI